MFHRFEDGQDASASLVRSTELSYDENGVATTLTSVTVRGWNADGTTASLPALAFTYAAASPASSVQFVDGIDDLPRGFDFTRFQWIDLDGEGLSGLLAEQGGAWYYKRNEGAGALARARVLPTRPALDLARREARLVDVDGDGRLDAVRTGGGVAGYFTQTSEGGWEPFRSFRQVPNLDLNAPQVRLVDLDGDGRADVLVTEDDVFTWYPSEGTLGYGRAERVWMARDEDKGPTAVFSTARRRSSWPT